VSEWTRIDEAAAAGLLDYQGVRPDDPNLAQVAPAQLRGAVATHNRLAERRVAWLADEVGMGKTYVALGVVALMRHRNPDARVLFLVPSGRLQEKWQKEIRLFTRSCVTRVDHRARTWQGLPARPLVEPPNLFELAVEMSVDADRDVLASMSSFSFPLGEEREEWHEKWKALAALAPHLPVRLPDAYVAKKDVFKRVYAAALNLLLPSFDLVVCDEAHNLRAGAAHGAARNLTMAAALGAHREGPVPWSAPAIPRVARLLCLTATPVERQYAELARQADVFGLHQHPATPPDVRADLAQLRGGPGTEDGRKDIARRYVIRRLQELRPGNVPLGSGLTKNQYRREWRHGGVATWDDRLAFASDREKLVVALVQKRVVELLHETGARTADGTFLPSFQMGMLSSFESFSETIGNKVGNAEPAYDGEDQTADPTERQGVDSGVVDRICRSYRRTFGTSPPHPKMDQVADQVARWATAGDKTLVFVRRVRSTEELADKIIQRLDERLLAKVVAEVPASARAELDLWLAAWREIRRDADAHRAQSEAGDDEDDAGGANSFFAWFFRGSGKEDHQVAARLRRDTLQRATHAWSIFFHDNHAAWLFEDDDEALAAWATANTTKLQAYARRFFPVVATPGPRHYFEAWQAAALELLGEGDGPAARVAAELRRRLHPERKAPWAGDPGGPDWVLAATFFSRLRRSEFGATLWPGSAAIVSGDALLEREVRRELMGSILRLGHPFVDLWLTAVRLLGVLTAGEADVRVPLDDLIDAFLDRLRAQRDAAVRTHDAWHELSELAAHHRVVVDVNFSDAGRVELADLRAYFQRHLSRQSPALAMHGGNKSTQALTQFRMPGYPLVLVATDVLQEGVDLHTFCARVVHYGIAHTSSATEQRTGRVDRIGSLVHRRFRPDDDASRLEVHYPHLLDTVEPLQLHELYRRMDLFLRLVHDGLGHVEEESSRVALHAGMQREMRYPAPPRERLRTAFDVVAEGPDSDLTGNPLPLLLDIYADRERLEAAVHALLRDVRCPGPEPRWIGEHSLEADGGLRRQPVEVALRSRRDGRGAYVRVASPVGAVELKDGRTAGKFLRRQSGLVGAVVTIEERGSRRRPFVVLRCDMPLGENEDPLPRLRRSVHAVAEQADALEHEFFGPGQDLSAGDWE
jgi:hypothetical protein